jgi:hypothetical protein
MSDYLQAGVFSYSSTSQSAGSWAASSYHSETSGWARTASTYALVVAEISGRQVRKRQPEDNQT